MFFTGLCSITFRKKRPREVVELVARAGLTGLEWGGDVHVPHGSLRRALAVRGLTEEAGLCVLSYGSYYRVVQSEIDRIPFDSVLETALELGAPEIRVWAGVHGSAEADLSYRERLVSESRRIADMAAAEGVRISYEFHRGTLNDSGPASAALLRDVAHPNVRTYWQPEVSESPAQRLMSLEQVLPYLSNLHVFHWSGQGSTVRLALAQGREEWGRYLAKAASAGGTRALLLEFVRRHQAAPFLEDAQTLKDWAWEFR